MRRFKLYFALLGFLLTVAGLYLDNRAIIWTAIVSLAVALGIRFWERRG